MVLPALLKGDNTVRLRLANREVLKANPLYVAYVFDQVDGRYVYRRQRNFTFAPDRLAAEIDTGRKHWPLMREIRMRCGVPLPEVAPAVETGELDWSAAAWDWAYWGVNFWNDFERGDRHGWRGRLTTKNTYDGSDFALDNSLMRDDGARQLKLIRHGAFLNRDSKFRCRLYVDKVKDLRIYSRNQGDKVYYEKTFTGFKQGKWQSFEVPIGELADPKDPTKKAQNGWFMANIYMVVQPAEGAASKDVQLLVDDVICYDGKLVFDPFTDADAPRKALGKDPIWTAGPPKGK